MSGIIRAPGGHVTVNETVRKMNPQVFAAGGSAVKLAPAPALQAADCKRPSAQSDASIERPARRIRQDTKPLLNKLETEWLCELERRHGPGEVKSQARKYKLGNGCWYCPDFFVNAKFLGGRTIETCYEVKGKHAWDDAMVKLKVAAHQWPEVRWILAWKENGQWREQQVLA